MITARTTRLLRVPDLHAFHSAIARVCTGEVARIRSSAILVSTHAAAEQLRQTLENIALLSASTEASAGRHANPGCARAAVWPDILTRDDWYERLRVSSSTPIRLLGAIEREVLMARAARDAVDAGIAPPFQLRPALVADMVGFFDTVLRLGRTLDGFERLLLEKLEPAVSIDRGAERLLRQTHFLVAGFRRYRELVTASGGCDEHLLRDRLLAEDGRPPFTRMIVTVGDRSCGRDGLWPVDFDLLARLPHLERVDIVATENMLAAGFLERLHDALPGIEEVDARSLDGAGRVPVLVTAEGAETPWWVSRDREEEIVSIARRIKERPAPALDRVAIVCKRPLPYLYLARANLGAAGIPFQAYDELPLAAEPFSAAVDLVFRFVESGFGRRPAIALLRSPQFVFRDENGEIARDAVNALETALADARADADPATLDQLVERWSNPEAEGRQRRAVPAVRVVSGIARDLAPLRRRQPVSAHLDLLLHFLEAHDRRGDGSPTAMRTARARAAVVGTLGELRAAHRQHDDPPIDFDDLVSRIRQRMEAQTFAPRTGRGGIHLLDADAARYGDFDEAYLVGVIEQEWPDAEGRNIFYPLALLNQLGWPPERLRLASARAAFRDLVRLPGARLSVSAFVLEDDALVEPSPFLDEIERGGFTVIAEDPPRHLRIVPDDALSLDPVRADVLGVTAREWAELRQNRSCFEDSRFHGSVSPAVRGSFAVRRLEMYLDCPFKYFAEAMLGLRDESDDDLAEGPRIQGQFLHELLADFFAAWQNAGRGAITSDHIDAARDAFAELVNRRLAPMGPAEAALWRARLLGSAARPGIGEMVFRAEAATGEAIVERLLEHHLDGPCRLHEGDRTVKLHGVADRIDVLDGHRLRILDYKLGHAPDIKRAVQLPLYAVHAVQQMASERHAEYGVTAAAYLAFGERKPYVPITSRGLNVEQAIAQGEGRALEAIAGIESGTFPPRPAAPFLCAHCPYVAVCRKDYVDEPQ